MKKSILIFMYLVVSITLYSQSISEGLQGWYPFSGNANDVSPNGYNGVVHGAVLTIDRFWKENSAYSFDGIDDFIELPESFDYPERTYSAWFSADSIIAYPGNAVVNCDHNNLQYGHTKIRLREVDSVDYLRFNYSVNPVHVPIALNRWYLATITVKDSTRYYINDSLVAAVPLGDLKSIVGLPYATIGAGRDNRAYMDGKIDDVRFYDRALSLEEIEILFAGFINSYNELPQNDNLKVFPNPTVGLLYIETVKLGSLAIEITTLNGQVIYSTEMEGASYQIDLSPFQKGVYFITIRSKDFVTTRKIIKL